MPESIIDASRPNGGRIYDYILGGHHNFEIDRQAAEQVKKLLPFVPQGARLQRWCLQDIAEELTVRRGFDVIIDFASGLPTQDHIHHRVPAGTTVIYSDIDPVTIEYAREILKDVPNTYAWQADAAHPEELLENSEVQAVLKGRRDVAFVVWGVGNFLSKTDLQHLARYLYDWSGPKSCVAFHAQGAGADRTDPANLQVVKIYDQMGTALCFHSLEEYTQDVLPWHPDEQGFIPLLKWHGLDPAIMQAEDVRNFGPGGGGYGGYLVK